MIIGLEQNEYFFFVGNQNISGHIDLNTKQPEKIMNYVCTVIYNNKRKLEIVAFNLRFDCLHSIIGLQEAIIQGQS